MQTIWRLGRKNGKWRLDPANGLRIYEGGRMRYIQVFHHFAGTALLIGTIAGSEGGPRAVA
ncbi:MAG: hypothetical protein KatS3mg110_2414 [Pirellulaceae bacterium]|nr:MAG: hypothetical protein KatS3mg110_2414 [Pirellulaceae bacterium]